MLRHHWLWRRMWKNEERKTAPRVIRIFDRRYPAWMRCLSAPWEPISHFLSSPRALQCTIGVRRPGCAQLCIFIAPKHRPYPHHQVQKFAKICHNCIQSPSITNSQMFYLEPDRWSEDDFSIECILWLRELSHFPSSMTLFTNHRLVISLSISALWDYVIGGEMSEWAGNDLGRFSHHLVTLFSAWRVESYPYQRSYVAWSLVGIGWWCGEGEHFFRIFRRILDDVKPNSLMGNWGLGENESLHLSRRNWLAGAHNSFRLHSLTVIRIYKIVFSGFLWQCASKTNHHLATHWAHLTRYCCFSYHHGVRGKQRNRNPIIEAERVLHQPTQACF